MLRRLRSSSRLKAIPVLVMTAAGAKAEEHARAAGCDEFLAKPVSFEKLGHCLHRLISSTATPAGAGTAAW